MTVQHTADTLDFLDVTILGRWQLFVVEAQEPDSLAEVRTLSGYLEHEPLVLDVLFG